MTTYFVTRHKGALDWIAEQGLAVDEIVEHFDTACINQDDIVIGSLPVNLVAKICDEGARYFHMILIVPLEMRGRELSNKEMQDCGASLVEYRVKAVSQSK